MWPEAPCLALVGTAILLLPRQAAARRPSYSSFPGIPRTMAGPPCRSRRRSRGGRNFPTRCASSGQWAPTLSCSSFPGAPLCVWNSARRPSRPHATHWRTDHMEVWKCYGCVPREQLQKACEISNSGWCELYVYPNLKIIHDYLAWRQVDCLINNQYNTCFWMLDKSGKSEWEAHLLLKGTFSKDKNKLLSQQFQMNDDEPAMFRKRIQCLLKEGAREQGFLRRVFGKMMLATRLEEEGQARSVTTAMLVIWLWMGAFSGCTVQIGEEI